MFLVLDQPCALAGERFGGDCGKDGSDAESQWEPKQGEDFQSRSFCGHRFESSNLVRIPFLRAERCWELRVSEGLQIGRGLRSHEGTAGRVQFADGGGELSAMVSRSWFRCLECFRFKIAKTMPCIWFCVLPQSFSFCFWSVHRYWHRQL